MNSDVDRRVRAVARNLIESTSTQSAHRPLLSHSQSIQILASQEAAAGWRRDGHMSSVRRFFCLYCTFDLLFTALIWLTCVMITGASIYQMWQTEILSYSIHTSLIDIVGVACIRYIILLITYAMIHLDHWCAVAFTTSGSCAFLIAKVFVFDWIKTQQPVFEVSFILISFALCWSEAWFLDCKVLPAEYQAKEILATVDDIEQHQPIIRGNRIGIPSDLNSFTDYYSPRDSPDSSPTQERRQFSTLSHQDESYVKQGQINVNDALLLRNSLGWRECCRTTIGDTVQFKNTEKFGKVFLLTAIVDCSAETIFDELNEKAEDIPTWNPAVIESKILNRINNETDITYQLSASVGVVASRDFVNLRRSVRIGELFICSGASINYTDLISTNRVRGENKISCWIMQPMPKQPRKVVRCRFQWLLGCDLKVWGVPLSIVEKKIPTVMLDFLKHLREHIQKNNLK